MKIALVYDRVNKWGGAERVLLALHELFPDAPLYTSVYNPKTAPWAKVFPKIHTSFLQKLPLVKTSHELFPYLMPLAFESFDFDAYNLVISVSSEAAKGIITKPHTFHICYCLTPTRYLWSGYRDYFSEAFFRFVSRPVVSYLQTWDKIAAQRPDHYVSISKEVKQRIKKYYQKEAEVVYPPVTINSKSEITNTKQAQNNNYSPRREASKIINNGYFLIVSRLVSYKRIDIAVEAFNRLGWQLKIVGIGNETSRLKAVAQANIEFVTNLTDEELSRYYQDCIALIVPGREDFGLAILEAQWFGKPVIAFQAGGALETVIAGKTGELFYPQKMEALIKVLRQFHATDYKAISCRKQAQRFKKEIFMNKFKKSVGELVQVYQRI